MSDSSFIDTIILNLEEERLTRITETRILTDHIQRLTQIRTAIAAQVRQRHPTSSTHRTYTAENREQTRNDNAPTFFQDRRNIPQEHSGQANADATNEDATPEVTQEELEFIAERGYLDDQHRRAVENRRRPTRTDRRRHSRQRLAAARRQEQEEDRLRVVTAVAARNITRDILRGIHVNIRSERTSVYRNLSRRHTVRFTDENGGSGRTTSNANRDVN